MFSQQDSSKNFHHAHMTFLTMEYWPVLYYQAWIPSFETGFKYNQGSSCPQVTVILLLQHQVYISEHANNVDYRAHSCIKPSMTFLSPAE